MPSPWSGPIRIAYLLVLWVCLLSVLGVAPSGDEQDGARVLAFFQLSGEPIAVAVFNLLGVIPLAYAAILLRDPPQRLPSWIPAALSFVVGGFALLPGLALRRWGAAPRSELSIVRRALTGPWMGGLCLLATLGLLALALTGDPQAFVELAQRSPLVFVMSADLLVLLAAMPEVVHDDIRRHGATGWRSWLWLAPPVGAFVWLMVRGSPPREG